MFKNSFEKLISIPCQNQKSLGRDRDETETGRDFSFLVSSRPRPRRDQKFEIETGPRLCKISYSLGLVKH